MQFREFTPPNNLEFTPPNKKVATEETQSNKQIAPGDLGLFISKTPFDGLPEDLFYCIIGYLKTNCVDLHAFSTISIAINWRFFSPLLNESAQKLHAKSPHNNSFFIAASPLLRLPENRAFHLLASDPEGVQYLKEKYEIDGGPNFMAKIAKKFHTQDKAKEAASDLHQNRKTIWENLKQTYKDACNKPMEERSKKTQNFFLRLSNHFENKPNSENCPYFGPNTEQIEAAEKYILDESLTIANYISKCDNNNQFYQALTIPAIRNYIDSGMITLDKIASMDIDDDPVFELPNKSYHENILYCLSYPPIIQCLYNKTIQNFDDMVHLASMNSNRTFNLSGGRGTYTINLFGVLERLNVTNWIKDKKITPDVLWRASDELIRAIHWDHTELISKINKKDGRVIIERYLKGNDKATRGHESAITSPSTDSTTIDTLINWFGSLFPKLPN